MACSAVRSASSGLVLVRRLAFMFAVTPGDVGNGYRLPGAPASLRSGRLALEGRPVENLRAFGGQTTETLTVEARGQYVDNPKIHRTIDNIDRLTTDLANIFDQACSGAARRI